MLFPSISPGCSIVYNGASKCFFANINLLYLYIILGLLCMKSLEVSDTDVGNAGLCHLSGEELQHL